MRRFLSGLFTILAALASLLLVVPVFGAGHSNVVLITLDSVRADRMDFLGSRRGLTPNLAGLAKQSIIFEHAYSQSPLTLVSHATILSGTYPQTHQASELGTAIPAAVPLLADVLRGKGYRTAAFVGSILLDPRSGPAQGLDRGFEFYDAGLRQPNGVSAAAVRRGDEVVGRATNWLARKAAGPFFLWVHIGDAHAPYSSYDSAVKAADAAVGKLLAGMRAQKELEDTAIIVAADHGESLGSHLESTHGVFLYDDSIGVPLLVRLPQGGMAGKRVAAKVRLLDVAPTVLEVAGVAVPSQMQGQSLLRIAKSAAPEDQPAYARSDFPQWAFGWSGLESWRAGKYLYVRAPQPELYDLSADPGAARNLAASSKGTLDTLAGQLDGFDRRFAASGKSGGAELSSSEMQKLASLGYVGLQKAGGPASAATGTDPKSMIAAANRTLAALDAVQEGKPEKAVMPLQQVIAAQPNSYLPRYVLGLALANQQQYPGAIEQLHRAIELQPESPWAHYEMGLCLMKTNDAKTAAVHLEIATARLPHFSEAQNLLAQAYDKLGRPDDAKRARTRAGQ
jgi:arylsulfatase A-like enzyme/Flp pilus assembly protein TadD